MQINPKPVLSRVGGKAYQLYRLKRWCNVPPFFVVVFEIPEEIASATNQHKIIERCRLHKFNLMAVRSSASCEDSELASFAGMFKTVLGVRPPELVDAISEVLTSASDKRISHYCEAHGLAQDRIRMAVIVQKMTNSRISGVCLTQIQNNANSLVVEACFGLGEGLVSGKITPDSYMVDRDTLSVVRESIGYQKVMLRIPSEKASPTYEEVPFYKRNSRKLTYDEITDVAKTSLAIENRLKFYAADVEWTFEGKTLYVLQARPCTGL